MALSALDQKLRALKHRLTGSEYYYHRELRAAYFWSRAQYYLRLIHDTNFREMVLREDWIREG
jgi:peptidoglycan hydrolase CwlO-like protein